MKLKSVIYVICEGKSEEVYLKELNKYFRTSNYVFVPYNLNGVFKLGKNPYKHIGDKCREAIRNSKSSKSKNDTVVLWIDYDVIEKKYLLESNLNFGAQIKFNYQNFEDFLILHLSDEKIQKWQKICEEHCHFKTPLEGDFVLSLIKELFPKYFKGSLPEELTEDLYVALNRLCINQEDSKIKFKSDFVDIIKSLLN